MATFRDLEGRLAYQTRRYWRQASPAALRTHAGRAALRMLVWDVLYFESTGKRLLSPNAREILHLQSADAYRNQT